jgi:hypothetical protein
MFILMLQKIPTENPSECEKDFKPQNIELGGICHPGRGDALQKMI